MKIAKTKLKSVFYYHQANGFKKMLKVLGTKVALNTKQVLKNVIDNAKDRNTSSRSRNN